MRNLRYVWVMKLLAASAVSAGCAAVNAASEPLIQQVSLAPILEKVFPSTVNISVKRKALPIRRLHDGLSLFFGDAFLPMQRPVPDQMKLGSGVITDAFQGYVVTNYHLVQEAAPDGISVHLHDGSVRLAKVHGFDKNSDLALLQLDEVKGLQAISMADSESLRVGDFVIAVGNSLGFSQTATYGIVSGLDRKGIGGNDQTCFIQTDAGLNPGNSGGALLNTRGELVGINSMHSTISGGHIGIGFAVPSNVVRSVIAQLMAFGKVRKCTLGILPISLNEAIAKAFNVKVHTGVFVKTVEPDSAAKRAGILAGDVIVSVANQPVLTVEGLREQLDQIPPETRMSLEVLRGGQSIVLTVLSEEETVVSGHRIHPLLCGAHLQDDTYGEGAQHVLGVLVTEVARGSTAERGGIRAQDMIIGVNNFVIDSLGQLYEAIDMQESVVALRILRNGVEQFLFLA